MADGLRSFCEHAFLDDEYVSGRLVTYSSNLFERWFLSPLNMNHHAAHHLWPSIPYYHLPKITALMRVSGVKEVVWRESYISFLWKYFRREVCRQ
jgi:fatty acid desaturase